MIKKIGIGMLIGFIITLITGSLDTTPKDWVGGVFYGFPLEWRIVQVTATPTTHYNIANFLVDSLFWIVIVLIVIYLWVKYGPKKEKSEKQSEEK